MSADLEEAGDQPRRQTEGEGSRELGHARAVDVRSLFDDAFALCAWLSGDLHPLDVAVGLQIRADGPPRPSLGGLAWVVGPMEPGDRPALLVASLGAITEQHLGALLVLLARASDGQAVVVAPTFSRDALDVLRWVSAVASPGQQLRLVAVTCRFISVDGSRPAPLLEVILDTAERAPEAPPLEGILPERPSSQAAGANPAAPSVPPATEPMTALAGAPEEAGSPAGALWSAYLSKVALDHPDWRVLERSETRCLLEPPRRDVVVAAEALPGFRLRSSLVIGPAGRPSQAEARFNLLERERAAFEQRFGGALAWEALPLRGVFRISDYAAGDPTELDEHADYVRFLGETADRLVLAYDSVLAMSSGATPGSASDG